MNDREDDEADDGECGGREQIEMHNMITNVNNHMKLKSSYVELIYTDKQVGGQISM